MSHRNTQALAIVCTNDGKLFQVKDDGEFWSSLEVRPSRVGFVVRKNAKWELMSKVANGAHIFIPAEV